MKTRVLCFVGLLFLGSPSFAISASKETSYQTPYGMNGCGLWSLVIQGKDQGSQLGIFALKTVVFPDFQTSAISTGSSNCVNSGTRQAMLDEQNVFVQVNLDVLEKEAAQGQGETLESFSELLGCKDHKAFAEWSQSNYHLIFSQQDPGSVVENYRVQLHRDEQTIKCSRLQS
jgi:hypothetical protein